MCGRFVSASPPDEIARYFDAELGPEPPLEPNYNVAPTDDVYVVVDDGTTRRLDEFHWGLVPFWAKDLSVGNRMINARAEGIADKGAFKEAFRKRRCIVPADGFFEWKRLPGSKKKQPYYVRRADGEPFAFAGLWARWRDREKPDTPAVQSCAIVTTDPNEVLADLHDRMPVILPPAAWDTWLDPANSDVDLLGDLLVPLPPALVTLHPVSPQVNDVRNQGPHLIDPYDPGPGPDPRGSGAGESGGARQGTLL